MSEEEGVINCKVVLLDESGVGKTSIIHRYLHNKFKECIMASSGANFAKKTIILKEENKSI